MKYILIISILLPGFIFSQTKNELPFKNIEINQEGIDVINTSFNKAPCTSTQTNDDCANATSLTPNGACINQTTCDATIEAGEPAPVCDNTQTQTVWYSFVATSTSMTISTDIGGSSCFLTTAIYSGTCGALTQISCADNTTVLTNQVSPVIIGDTYLVQVAYGGGGPCGNEGTFCIDVADTPAGSSDCELSTPFCTGNTETYSAGTGTTAPAGPDYGCLLSQPNPAWFYLEIGIGGDVEITITNSNTNDIDYIIWGPFTDITTGCSSLTAANTEDCSYSIASTEIANITGANAGETYIMMINNYSNTPTDISFSQTAGTGTTDCSILPVTLSKFDVYCDYAEWSTLTETNNDYFELEVSKDAISWTILNIRKGAGNSSIPRNYNVKYESQKGLRYFRLKQTDYNGTINYSHIESINCPKSDKDYIYYNVLGQEVKSTYSGPTIKRIKN